MVRDGSGGTGTATVRIDVGNTPPVPIILNPPEGVKFAVGDLLTLSGEATDPEDGELPPSSLEWEVRQMHAEHYHPFLDPTSGNDVPVQAALSPEDFYSTQNSFLQVRLTATDFDGLSATVVRNVLPKTVVMTFDYDPPELSGLDVLLDGESIGTPADIVTWENHPLKVEAPEGLSDAGRTQYTFGSWSDGGLRSRVLAVPSSSASLTASYERDGPPPDGVLTFEPTDDAVFSPAQKQPVKGKNYLFVDADKDFQSLLRFVVSGVGGGGAEKAILRLYAAQKASDFGGTFAATVMGDDGGADWDEDTVTAETAPNSDVDLGSLGPVVPDT